MKTWISAIALTASTFGFAGSAHAQFGYGKLVDSWYHRYLGRHVDPIGLRSHVVELERGTPVDFVEASILGSTEYYLRNGGTPEGFILGLYGDVVGVTPAPGDLRNWLRRFYHTDSRHLLALRFLRENRFTALEPDPFIVAPTTVYTLPPVVVSPPAYVPASAFLPSTVFGPRTLVTDPRPTIRLSLRFGR